MEGNEEEMMATREEEEEEEEEEEGREREREKKNGTTIIWNGRSRSIEEEAEEASGRVPELQTHKPKIGFIPHRAIPLGGVFLLGREDDRESIRDRFRDEFSRHERSNIYRERDF